MFNIRPKIQPIILRGKAMSSSVKKVVKIPVSPSLTLRRLDHQQPTGNPLVLFFEWLRAPPSAVDKYCDLYHSRGMDVLTVKGNVGPFLMPRKAKDASRDLLDYLISSQSSNQRPFMFVHCLSVGAYLYSVVLMEMKNNLGLYGHIADSIRGQVFDSIVVGSLEHMGVGIAAAANANKLTEWIIRAGMAAYFALNRSSVVPFYNEAISAFKNNFMKGPVLVFYSLNDPMADPRSMEEIVSLWNADSGFRLVYKCWEESVHAGHLRLHPHDYTSTFNIFFNRYNISLNNADKERVVQSKL